MSRETVHGIDLRVIQGADVTNKCCVGRVGGLAATLGVGVLLTLCAPTALADDDSPGSASSQDSSQQQDSSTKSDDKQSARAEPAKTDAKEERSSTAEDPADEDDDTRPPLSERGSVAESSRDEEPSDDPPADADTEDASEVEASPPDDLPPAEPAVHWPLRLTVVAEQLLRSGGCTRPPRGVKSTRLRWSSQRIRGSPRHRRHPRCR